MKAADSWTTYRTRFLVKAKQLATSFSFTDALGRQHSGRKGDYLVEFTGGILRIASRELFEDIYVPITLEQSRPSIPANAAMPLLQNSTDLKAHGFSRAPGNML
jgi:hypothetical protein